MNTEIDKGLKKIKILQRVHASQLKQLKRQQAQEMAELRVQNFKDKLLDQGFVYVVISDSPDGNDDSPKNMLLVPEWKRAKRERIEALIKLGISPYLIDKDEIKNDNRVNIVKRDIIKEPLSDAEISELRQMYPNF